MRAPALDESYKEDFLLLVTESLIKAVEARLDKKPEMVQQALRQGFILTPYFAEQLPVYEKQEQAMLLYYRDMVAAIELRKEDARLSTVTFDRDAPTRAVKAPVAPEPAAAPLTGAAKTLDDAEKLYIARDLEKANALYLAALQQTDQKPMHAAAYYWHGAHRGIAEAPGGRRAAVPEDAGTGARAAGEGLDPGVSRPAGTGRGRAGAGSQVFSKRFAGGGRVGKGAHRRRSRASREVQNSSNIAKEFFGMKRMILTGTLALATGLTALMAQQQKDNAPAQPPQAQAQQGSKPTGPAPKSQAEAQALQALMQAQGNPGRDHQGRRRIADQVRRHRIQGSRRS